MSEVVIFKTMKEAGAAALQESRELALDDEETAAQVYIAMRGMFELLTEKGESERRH